MKCILHIGTEKTGTTTLQEFLNLNRKTLAKYGYLYTKSAGTQNNRTLVVAAYDADKQDDFTQTHDIWDDKALLTYRNTIINALDTEIKSVEGIHTTIFSSEHFQSSLKTDSELTRLREILNGLGFDQILIVVYLRAPVEIANSRYSTAIRWGETRAHPPGPDDAHWRNICDHRHTIMRFRNAFGLDAIVPRIYSKTDLVNGSIIDDFAAAIELLSLQIEYTIPQSHNESISATGLEILRRINQEIPPFDEALKPNPLRGNIELYVAKYFQDGQRYGMPIELRQQYEDAFRESNEWVRTEYFPERQMLFPTTNLPSPSASNLQTPELDQIAQLITAMWLESRGYYSSRTYKAMAPLWRLQSRITSVWGRR